MMIMLPDQVSAAERGGVSPGAAPQEGPRRRSTSYAWSASTRASRRRSCTSARTPPRGPTIESVHAFIAERGCQPRGKHHEIYLGDPRRTAPEKLRTVVRQPMSRKT